MEQHEIEEILSYVFEEEEAREELARELLKEVNPNYTEQEFNDFMNLWEKYDDTDPSAIIVMYQIQKENK